MGRLGSVQFVVLLMVLAIFAAFLELGRRDVLEDNEGQRATPPAEMIRSGNYVIPTINGKDYLSKPPLLYWAIAGVYRIAGAVTPLAARVPTALSYIALVFAVYLAGRRLLGEHAARWGALAVLASPYVMQRGRYAELDIPLTLAIFAAVLLARSGALAETRRRAALLVLPGAVAFAAGVLLKGPVPFIFLGAAFMAHLTVTGDNSTRWTIRAVRWTGPALLIALMAWIAGLAAAAFGRTPGVIAYATPAALIMTVAAWLVPAWRHAGPARWRAAAVFAAIAALGLLVAAPWGAAVLDRKGLAYVMTLLQSESLERTHTATAINSGSPFYYFVGLMAMLAPWGLLLPCHLALGSWKEAPPFYRFAVAAGWLSVVVFSLIAGKEYEYVLPAVPLLMLATGWQLARRQDARSDYWIERWHDVWLGISLPLLTLAALTFLIVVCVKSPAMIAPALFVALVALGCAVIAWRNFDFRSAALPVIALGAAMLWLLSQDYRHTGARSFRPMAETTGKLLQAGYEVEAVKMTAAFDVYPGFAFHAGAIIPSTVDPEHIRQKLAGDKPYYCVLRQKLLDETAQAIPPELLAPRMGPMGAKKLILIGNRPLPDLPDK